MRGRLVVTGGAGFLGQHVTAEARRAGWDVTVVDRAATDEVSATVADVRDRDVLRRCLEDTTAVVHAAYAPPHARSDDIDGVNVGGTLAVCEEARAAGIGRVVLISSTIVEAVPRRHPLASAPLSRLDDYRRSRCRAEQVAESVLGPRLTVIRPRTFVGPGRVGAFALVYASILGDGAVRLLGPGTNRVQLVDVRDLAELIVMSAAADVPGVLHAGASRVASVVDEFRDLIRHADSRAEVRTLPAPVGRVVARAIELAGAAPLAEWHHAVAERRDVLVDADRAEREIGWSPRRSNFEALCDSYDWYQRHAGRDGLTTHPVSGFHRRLAAVSDVTSRWRRPS